MLYFMSTADAVQPVYSLNSISLSSRHHRLFHDLNFSIFPGESFVIIGPSEAGKSVLLKMLAGLIAPDSGEVLFYGRPIPAHPKVRRKELGNRISMTFQGNGLFDSLTVEENILFPLREQGGLSRKEINAKARAILDQVGLGGSQRLWVHELSGGMKKRLGIARALVLSPQVVLYDDPTAGLDPVTSQAIVELICGMKKKDEMTVVMVTSDLEQAYRLADRVGFLYEGRFLAMEPPSSLRRSKQPVIKQFVHGELEGPLTI